MIFHDGSAGKRVFSSTSALGEPHAQASTRFFLIFFLYGSGRLYCQPNLLQRGTPWHLESVDKFNSPP